MAIVINGSGTVTGLSVGGLPDGTVDSDTLASGIDKTSISDSGDATAITINSSEQVGIGTTNPSGQLDIQTANGAGILKTTATTGTNACYGQFSNTGGGFIVGRDNSSGGILGGGVYASHLYSQGAYPLVFSTNSAKRMSIDATGAVTMPSQPAFLAWSNANATIANNTWTDIQFATERFDTGSDFNSATGIFTAPVTGKYQINYNVRIDGIAASVAHASVQIYTSNQDYAYQTIITPTAYDSILNYHSFNGSLLVDMDANDTAKLRALINGSTGNYGGWLGTTFSAHLVC